MNPGLFSYQSASSGKKVPFFFWKFLQSSANVELKVIFGFKKAVILTSLSPKQHQVLYAVT